MIFWVMGILTYEDFSYALFEAGFDELVEVPVENALCISYFDIGPQIFDPRLIEHVTANLVAPADICFRVLKLLLLRLTFAQFGFIQARLKHRHGLGPVSVLRPVALALNHDIGRNVGNPDR